jgi:rubrerythrin
MKDIKLLYDVTKKQKIISKRKETVYNRYGVDNVFKSNDVKQKSKETKILKYGDSTFTNPKKAKETNILRYGVANVMQVQEIANKVNLNKDHAEISKKVKKTKLTRYGDATYNNRSQAEKTNLEKYGVINAAQCSNVQNKISTSLRETFVLAHSEKYNITPMFAYEEYVPANKNKWRCNSCGSIINGKVADGKFTRCAKCYPFNTSKAEVLWLDSLAVPYECRQIFLKIGDRRYQVDALVGNTVYEFWGDFWHGNPKYYKADDINPKNKISFGVLYESTVTKRNLILGAGYELKEIWLSEWEQK